MNDISPLGWIALALVVVFLVLLNLSLFRALRSKNKTEVKNKSSALQRLGESVRNPWKTEDDMISELAKRTASLRGPSESSGESEDSSPKKP